MSALYNQHIPPVMSVDNNGDYWFTFFYDNSIGDDNYCQSRRSSVVIWHMHCSSNYEVAKMYGQQISQCSY